MEKGIVSFESVDIGELVNCFKKYGISRTFVNSERADFDEVMTIFAENGIICENLHAPFDKINDMWYGDEKTGGEMLDRLLRAVDRCAENNIPTLVVHLSSGTPMPEISEPGTKRFEKLFDYVKERDVVIALENQRSLKNLGFFLKRYPTTGFCWDTGHENCFTDGIRFMENFGNRLVTLHIHDNRCIYNSDDHILPFDGNIDFDYVARKIAESGYEGTLMLEVNSKTKVDGEEFYDNLKLDEYICRAVEALNRLDKMVDGYKR